MKAGYKKCPFCSEEIKEEATKCRYCGEFLNEVHQEKVSSKLEETKTFITPKTPTSNGIVKALGFVIAFLFFAGSAALVKTVLSPILYPPQTLSEIAAEVNKGFPMMIDSETRAERVVATNESTLNYKYTLVNVDSQFVTDQDITDAKNIMQPNIINSIKTSSDMDELKKRKVKFIYEYYDKNADFLFGITISPNQY